MLTSADFNFEAKTGIDYDSDIENVDDMSIPNLSKFENKRSRIPKKLQTERF